MESRHAPGRCAPKLCGQSIHSRTGFYGMGDIRRLKEPRLAWILFFAQLHFVPRPDVSNPSQPLLSPRLILQSPHRRTMSHALPHSRPTTPTPPSPAPISSSSRATTAPAKSKHHIPYHPHRLHHHRVPHSALQPPASNRFPDTQSPVSRISTRNEELEQERGREMRAKEEAEREKEVWKAVEGKREWRRRVDE